MISLAAFLNAETMSETILAESIEGAIHGIRGVRVMLDSDVAQYFGVTTKQLNQALARNVGRFPIDFAFLLEPQEFAALRSQIVTSKKGRGGRRYMPWVFTEHGVIMLASVLNSEVAVAASVRIVRTFVRLREIAVANLDISRRLDEVERRMDGHDSDLAQLFAAMRKLIAPPPAENREMGFHVREDEVIYGAAPLTAQHSTPN